jgi:Queuine tRNA-ribosyltransferase
VSVAATEAAGGAAGLLHLEDAVVVATTRCALKHDKCRELSWVHRQGRCKNNSCVALCRTAALQRQLQNSFSDTSPVNIAGVRCRGVKGFEYDAKPSKPSAVYFSTHGGARLLTPAQYMATVKALRPALFFTLADESLAHISRRRADSACKRTADWAQACLDSLNAPGVTPSRSAAASHGDGNGAEATAREAGLGAAVAPGAVGSIMACAVPHAGRHVAQGVARLDDKLAGQCCCNVATAWSRHAARTLLCLSPCGLETAWALA